MGYISIRDYLLIGLAVGLVVLGLGYFFGEDIASWAIRQDNEAAQAGLGFLGTIIMQPLRFAFHSDYFPFGAIVAGIFWPLTLLWPVLILFFFLAVEGKSFIQDQDTVV